MIPTPGGSACGLGKQMDTIADVVAPEDNVLDDIADDATDTAVEVGDVVEDSAANMEADVDYLVDSINDVAEKEEDNNVSADVEAATAQEDSTATPIVVVTEVPLDGKISSKVVSDPYSIGVKEFAARAVSASPTIGMPEVQVVEVRA
jgi:hypothetical protein